MAEMKMQMEFGPMTFKQLLDTEYRCFCDGEAVGWIYKKRGVWVAKLKTCTLLRTDLRHFDAFMAQLEGE